MTHPDNDAKVRWLAQETPETVLDPELPIIDPHHHLWRIPSPWGTYDLDDLWADTGSGHNVEQTVFIDARSGYRQDGPEHLKPVGESAFIATVAEQSAKATGKATIGAIISHAYMKLGAAVEKVLVGHLEAGRGLFRGIRSGFPQDLDARFLESFDVLARLDLTFDNFSFDYTRLPDLAKLANAYPEVPIIVNHLGGKIDPEASDDEFANWRQCIDSVARCPNVVLKVGGAQQAAGDPGNRRSTCIGANEPIGSEGTLRTNAMQRITSTQSRPSGPSDACSRATSRSTRNASPIGRSGIRSSASPRGQGLSESEKNIDLQWNCGTRVSRGAGWLTRRQ